MKIRELTEKDYEKYELFLLEFEDSLLYYSIKYKSVLEAFLRIESNYLLALDDFDNIQAVLPIMRKDGKYGVIINSLPFYGSNGGILGKNDEANLSLLNYYKELIKQTAGSTYITNPIINDRSITKIDYDISDKRIGQWTPINYSSDYSSKIMESYHSKTRNLVRKAIKLNIEVKIDNTQLDFLYKTHLENMISIGGRAKEKSFFELIDKYFEKGKDYNIYIALLNGEKIGALLLFYFNKTVEYFTPVAIQKYRSYQSTSLLIYQAMIDASKNNYKWWNWGGTWLSQHGVYHFKKRFGAIDKEYNYYIKINNKEIYNATKDELLNEYENFYVIPFDKLKN